MASRHKSTPISSHKKGAHKSVPASPRGRSSTTTTTMTAQAPPLKRRGRPPKNPPTEPVQPPTNLGLPSIPSTSATTPRLPMVDEPKKKIANCSSPVTRHRQPPPRRRNGRPALVRPPPDDTESEDDIPPCFSDVVKIIQKKVKDTKVSFYVGWRLYACWWIDCMVDWLIDFIVDASLICLNYIFHWFLSWDFRVVRRKLTTLTPHSPTTERQTKRKPRLQWNFTLLFRNCTSELRPGLHWMSKFLQVRRLLFRMINRLICITGSCIVFRLFDRSIDWLTDWLTYFTWMIFIALAFLCRDLVELVFEELFPVNANGKKHKHRPPASEQKPKSTSKPASRKRTRSTTEDTTTESDEPNSTRARRWASFLPILEAFFNLSFPPFVFKKKYERDSNELI